ncbi:MAG: tRNA (guanosine(46)-N7)-methyltransferase TrmB [Bacteroidales bacterium]|nr:tRNA (guanosine(46)-N7)-methyltransferase TrmB [Bacteroidales bacterium]
MSKNKLEKFAQMATFPNVVQPEDIKINDFEYKGKWSQDFFHNQNPITLELGCGKGEYTVALSQIQPYNNFIGVDIKGARIWNGAKKAIDAGIKNAGFLRTRIDMIDNFFGKDEVDEIWITFPDPQPKKQNKRLTSAHFLNIYRRMLKDGAVINLKTDSRLLHFYTLELLKANGIVPIVATDDLYNSDYLDGILCIKTFYEKSFLEQGKKITYLKFIMDTDKEIVEIPKFEFNE